MTNQEKITKIKAIYQNFLQELDQLKKQTDKKVQIGIQSIEQKQIDQLLDKIHNQL